MFTEMFPLNRNRVSCAALQVMVQRDFREGDMIPH